MGSAAVPPTWSYPGVYRAHQAHRCWGQGQRLPGGEAFDAVGLFHLIPWDQLPKVNMVRTQSRLLCPGSRCTLGGAMGVCLCICSFTLPDRKGSCSVPVKVCIRHISLFFFQCYFVLVSDGQLSGETIRYSHSDPLGISSTVSQLAPSIVTAILSTIFPMLYLHFQPARDVGAPPEHWGVGQGAPLWHSLLHSRAPSAQFPGSGCGICFLT